MQLFVNPLAKFADEAVLTIIMNSGDADAGHGSGRDWERNGLSGSISNAEGGVLGTILRDQSYLGLLPMVICYGFEINATTTYHREHPQGFVYCAVTMGIQSSKQVSRHHARIRTR